MVVTAPCVRVRPCARSGAQTRRSPSTSAASRLSADQLAAEFFESVVIETEAELDTAIRDAALGDEAPEDFFQRPAQSSRFRPRSPRPSGIADQICYHGAIFIPMRYFFSQAEKPAISPAAAKLWPSNHPVFRRLSKFRGKPLFY